LSYAYIELNKPAQARQAITSAQSFARKRRSHQASRRCARAADGGGGRAGDPSKLAAYRKSLDCAIAAFPTMRIPVAPRHR
jgi:hypothetical protein